MLVLLVDGNYNLHRAMHTADFGNYANSKGLFTGGCFGFLKTLQPTIRRFRPDKVIVVFDAGISERRRELLPQYKGARYRSKGDPYYEELTDENREYITKLIKQRKILTLLLKDMGVRVLRLKGWEADDLIYAYTKEFTDNRYVVMSDDKDMLQLIREGVTVFRPIAQELITVDNFFEAYNCSKHWYEMSRCCIADVSDNIPGVNGVGKKTLEDLYYEIPVECIDDYPFEKFFDYCSEHSDWRVRKISEGIYNFIVNYEVMHFTFEEITETVVKSLSIVLNDCIDFDYQKTKERFEKLEFRSLLHELYQWIVPFTLLR